MTWEHLNHAELERRMDAARQLRSEVLTAGGASMISALAGALGVIRGLVLEGVTGRSRVRLPIGGTPQSARSGRQTGTSGLG